MQGTDDLTIKFNNAYYKASIKYIDDFLMKHSNVTKHGADATHKFDNTKGSAENAELDRVIGALNTILMVVEDRIGLLTNWDQGSPTLAAARIRSYVPLGKTDTTVVRKNVNEGL